MKKNKVNKTEKVFVRLTADQVEYLDNYAKSLGIDRSKLIRLIIDESMTDLAQNRYYD